MRLKHQEIFCISLHLQNKNHNVILLFEIPGIGGLFQIGHCYVLTFPTVGQNWASTAPRTCWQDLFKQAPSSELKGSTVPFTRSYGESRLQAIGALPRILMTREEREQWTFDWHCHTTKPLLGMQQESIITRNSKFPIRRTNIFTSNLWPQA